MLLPWLRTAVQSGTYSERGWRNALLRRGFGKPLLDSKKTWNEHACGLAKHVASCPACRTVLALQEERLRVLPDGLAVTPETDRDEVRVLTREEAREDEDLIKMHPAISYDEEDPSSKFTAYRPSVGITERAALVSMFHRPLHEDRVRLFFPLAFAQMGQGHGADLVASQQLYEALASRKRTASSDAFFDNKDTRLDQHPVISSLIATNLPVSSLSLQQNDYTFFRQIPPRHDVIWIKDRMLENQEGITVLDMMRVFTDWSGGTELYNRELLPFTGIDWAPWEFRDLPGRATEDIEVGRKSGLVTWADLYAGQALAYYGGRDD